MPDTLQYPDFAPRLISIFKGILSATGVGKLLLINSLLLFVAVLHVRYTVTTTIDCNII